MLSTNLALSVTAQTWPKYSISQKWYDTTKIYKNICHNSTHEKNSIISHKFIKINNWNIKILNGMKFKFPNAKNTIQIKNVWVTSI